MAARKIQRVIEVKKGNKWTENGIYFYHNNLQQLLPFNLYGNKPLKEGRRQHDGYIHD